MAEQADHHEGAEAEEHWIGADAWHEYIGDDSECVLLVIIHEPPNFAGAYSIFVESVYKVEASRIPDPRPQP